MFNHIFKSGVLDFESKNIAVSAVILAVAAAASRLLGILRDWLLAERFGASPDLDVYFAAFRIPDFIYNILVFGGIVVAFLPLFSDYYAKNKEAAWRFANNTLNIFFVLLIVLSVILFIFTPQLLTLVVPGFSAEQLAKTVLLTRLMFLSPIIFGVASVFSGILQYFQRFLAYSLAASLYNLGIIAGIIFFAPSMGIFGVAAGVIAGALLYLFIQVIPAIKCGFCYRPIFDFHDRSLYRVFALMLPRTLGIAANQINLIAPTIIASALAAGSITIFNLANNLYSIPVGIIGISWAVAAFAPFSKYFAQGQIDKLAQKFSETYRQIGYFIIPCGLLIFVLRSSIVDILYRHGQFTGQAALLTSASLGLFCLGIYFSAMMPVIFRLFFALRDTLTPTLTTVISVAANIFMNYWLVAAFQGGAFDDLAKKIFALDGITDISVLGLALAYSLANVLQFAILIFLLYRKNPALVRVAEIVSSLAKTILAGAAMSLAVYLINGIMPKADAMQLFIGIIACGATGVCVYIAVTALLKSPELMLFASAMKKYGTNRTKPAV